MMKCRFAQLYGEVGTSFSLGMVLKPLSARLNALQKHIPVLAEKLKADDFVVTYIITATRNSDLMFTKGPILLRADKSVEFAIWIPYKEISDFGARIEYVLGQVGQGIEDIMEKYSVDSGGVYSCVEEMIALVKQSPLDYQYPP